MPDAEFLRGSAETTEHMGGRDLLIYGGRVLVVTNPESGRADEANEHIEDLRSSFDIQLLPTLESDPFANAQSLATRLPTKVKEFKPHLIVLAGGDTIAWAGMDSFFKAAQVAPEIMDIEMAILAYGTGNDVALSLSHLTDLRDILRYGHTVDYRPPELTITKPGADSITETYYAGGNIGIGATGYASKEINSDQTHGHAKFKEDVWRQILLGQAGLRSLIKSKTYISEEVLEGGKYGPEETAYGRIFFHARRFGIHGRTSARFADHVLREVVLNRKYSARTALYMGAFLLGKAGVKIPSHIVEGAQEFRITPAHDDQEIYAHIDDTELPIEPGSVVKVGLAERSAKVLTTRRRP